MVKEGLPEEVTVPRSPEGLGDSRGRVCGRVFQAGVEKKMQSPRMGTSLGSPRNRKKSRKPAGNQGSGKGKAWREGTAGSGNVIRASRDTGGLEAGHWQGPPTSTPGQESTAGLQDEGRERGQARGGGGLALVAEVRGGPALPEGSGKGTRKDGQP